MLKLDFQEVGVNILWYKHGSQLGPNSTKTYLYRSGGKYSEGSVLKVLRRKSKEKRRGSMKRA